MRENADTCDDDAMRLTWPSCRRLVSFVGLAIPLVCLISGCAMNTQAATKHQVVQVRNATARYVGLVLAMDHHGIAMLFTPDGEMQADRQPAIRGREAIERHLQSFAEYKVLDEALTADSIQVSHDTAQVAGRYRQRVRVPTGDTVSVGGRYTAEWVRQSHGAWHIRRMATTASR